MRCLILVTGSRNDAVSITEFFNDLFHFKIPRFAITCTEDCCSNDRIEAVL